MRHAPAGPTTSGNLTPADTSHTEDAPGDRRSQPGPAPPSSTPERRSAGSPCRRRPTALGRPRPRARCRVRSTGDTHVPSPHRPSPDGVRRRPHASPTPHRDQPLEVRASRRAWLAPLRVRQPQRRAASGSLLFEAARADVSPRGSNPPSRAKALRHRTIAATVPCTRERRWTRANAGGGSRQRAPGMDQPPRATGTSGDAPSPTATDAGRTVVPRRIEPHPHHTRPM